MLKTCRARVRHSVALAIGLLGVLTLAACTPESALRARVADGEVEFMVCRPIQAQSIVIAAAKESEGVEYKDRWHVEGSGLLSAGDTFVYGRVPDGWRQVLPPSDLSLDSESIYVVISGEESTQVAVFQAGTLGETWSSETGAVDSVNPCGT